MKKSYIFGLIALAATIIGLAWAEQLTFTTYYPAPYGRYREFSTSGKTTLATDEYGREEDNARVGIGTTDPQGILHVAGGNANNARGRDIILQAESGDPAFNYAGGNIILLPGKGSGGEADGNVGIGTTGPQASLHVLKDSFVEVLAEAYYNDLYSGDARFKGRRGRGTKTSPSIVQNGDRLATFSGYGYDGSTFQCAGSIIFMSDGTPGANDMPGRISFGTTLDGTTDGYQRMVIDNAGNVGIGTGIPEVPLHVATSTYIEGNYWGGNHSAGDFSAYFAGNIISAGHHVHSDLRLKNVQSDYDTEGACDKIAGLTLKQFRYNDEISQYIGKDPSQIEVGLIAQEVEEIIPDAVVTGLDVKNSEGEVVVERSKTIDTYRLLMESIGAIQELIKENDNLKAQNKETQTLIQFLLKTK